MALLDDAVYTAARGYIFTAPVGTATAPTVGEVDAYVPGAAIGDWENIGHTARDELPVFAYEGGDTETRGTWQTEVLKTVVTEPASDYVTFNVHQFDNDTLAMYYGAENTGDTPGVFEFTNSAATGIERALLIVIVDGDYRIAFHAPKVSIRREDSIELAVDEFAYMPLRATLLTDTGSDYRFAWINTTVYSGS